MKKAADYRRHAQECRALAKKVETEAQRVSLLQMAETWDSLATERERFVADYPELAATMDREMEN